MKVAYLLFFAIVVSFSAAGATSPDGLWLLKHSTGNFSSFSADENTLEKALYRSKWHGSSNLWLPGPDGNYLELIVTPSSVMQEGLAKRYPQISTYSAVGVSTAVTGRLDLGPRGFHAMLQDGSKTWFIDPGTDGEYRVSSKRTRKRHGTCEVDVQARNAASSTLLGDTQSETALRSNGATLRTFRLAVATTSAYSISIDGDTPSKANVLASIVTAVNRVNQVYNQDVAVHLELVANNDAIIFTDPGTDPYEGLSISGQLQENQDQIDNIIGNANYDVGHLFDTNGGSGIATLESVCWDGFKARGVSGHFTGILESDFFYIDLLAHEMGHQFGAHHTFNSDSQACSGNRTPETAWEPGSGSTIMSYAGICSPENLQENSDAYFHSGSIGEIIDFLENAQDGGFCAATSSSGDTPPEVLPGTSESIPARTPFMLTAQATDADVGDTVITFTWDQVDTGTATSSAEQMASDDGSRPLFRSWSPTTDNTRYFPRLEDVLNATSTTGETLPATDRMLTFSVVARSGGYGIDMEEVSLNVKDTGSVFSVITPGSGSSLIGGEAATINWDIAGTDLSPISCANVDILYSADGGTNFDTFLASSTTNDGLESVTMPADLTDTARILVRCSDNVFFNVNEGDFSIVAPTETVVSITADSDIILEGNSGLTPFTFTVSRSGDTSGESSVSYSVSGTGTSAASAGDFENSTFPSGTVNFLADETEQSITINVSGDTSFESSQDFAVTLESPTNALLGIYQAISTIRNDDAAPTPPETDPPPVVEEPVVEEPVDVPLTVTTPEPEPEPEPQPVTDDTNEEDTPAPIYYKSDSGGGSTGFASIAGLLVFCMYRKRNVHGNARI